LSRAAMRPERLDFRENRAKSDYSVRCVKLTPGLLTAYVESKVFAQDQFG